MQPAASAVILAAGRSTRFALGDKQLVSLLGKPVLAHSIQAFEDCDLIGEIIVVTNDENAAAVHSFAGRYSWRKLIQPVCGGERRQDSVLNGLRAARGDMVCVHDGARPLVTPDIIIRGIEAAQTTGAAIAAVPATDTIKIVDEEQIIAGTPDRNVLWLAQTPQVFRRQMLVEAYETANREGITLTDDAAAVERLGIHVKVFMASYENIKITNAIDIDLATAILRMRRNGATE